MLLACGAGASEKEARKLAEQARRAEKSGRVVEAYLLWCRAVAEDPRNLEWWQRAEALKPRALLAARERLPGLGQASDQAEAGTPGQRPARAEGPTVESEPLPLPELKPNAGRQTLRLRGEARAVFEQVAMAFGLQAVFDADYPAGQHTVLELESADWREALRAAEAATASFVVPLNERQLLVVRDTPQKRQEREPLVALTVAAPAAASPEEVQELRAAIQQVMQAQRVAFDPARNVFVIRERASVAYPARRLLEQLLNPKPVVAIEIELVDVSRRVLERFGISLPTQFPLVWFGSLFGSRPVMPPGFTEFAVFGAGRTLVGLGISSAQMLAQSARSAGELLYRAELKSVSGQTVTLHLGERFPIVTAREIVPSPDWPITYPPTFMFEDLGLVVKASPRVHGQEEVTLALEMSFRLLTGEVVNEIPVVSNRSLQSEVRLRSGQWAVVAGLMSSTEARMISGLAGVVRIPVLSWLLANKMREESERSVMVMIRPRVVERGRPEVDPAPIALGPELRPRIFQ